MKKIQFLSMSLLISASLSGCNSTTNINEPLVASNYVKNTLSYQKQGAAISLVNSQVNLDAAGVEYEIDFTIDSKYTSADMEVSVTSSDGLYIVTGDTSINETILKGETSLPFTITATEEGRHYLHAIFKVDNNGVKRSRALSLIVQVGEEIGVVNKANASDSKISLKNSNGAQKVYGDPISLKAVEDIVQ